MEILDSLLSVFGATLKDVAPIVAVIFGFQYLVIRRPIPHMPRFMTGLACVVVGLAFFLEGLDLALFPLGRTMAEQLTNPQFVYGGDLLAEAMTHHWSHYYWIYLFALAIGFSAVLVEPAVLAVALKAN